MITMVRENEITDIPSRISQTRKCKAVTELIPIELFQKFFFYFLASKNGLDNLNVSEDFDNLAYSKFFLFLFSFFCFCFFEEGDQMVSSYVTTYNLDPKQSNNRNLIDHYNVYICIYILYILLDVKILSDTTHQNV